MLANLAGDIGRVGNRVGLLESLDQINRNIDRTGSFESLDR